MFVFCVYCLLEDLFKLARTDLFSGLVDKTFGEEILKGIDSVRGVDVLAVYDSRDGRDVEAGYLRDVFKDHRAKVAFVSAYEEIVLVVQQGLHGLRKGIVALLESLDKPLRAVQFLLHEGRRFLLLAVGSALGLGQHIGVLLIYPQLGDVEAGHLEGDIAVVSQFKDEVGDNLLGNIRV